MLGDTALVQLLSSRAKFRRDALPLLPHLRSLDVAFIRKPRSMTHFLSGLLHPGLECLKVTLPTNVAECSELGRLVKEAITHAPHLKRFKLSSRHPGANASLDLDELLSESVGGWSLLQVFRIPTWYLTRRVFDALVEKGTIEEIYGSWDEEFGIVNPLLAEVPAAFRLLVPGGMVAFQSLKRLTLRMRCETLDALFGAPRVLPSLEELALELVPAAADYTVIAPLFGHLAASCPVLKALTMRTYEAIEDVNANIKSLIESAEDQPHFSSLKHLSQLSRLQHLYIDARYPLMLTDDEMLELAQMLPNVLTLHLNPEPQDILGFVGSEIPLSLSVLEDIGESMEKLQTLRVFVDTSFGLQVPRGS